MKAIPVVRRAIAALVLACCACSPKARVHASEATGQTLAYRIEVPHSPDASDLARFLAGMPGRDGSPFRELEQSEDWKAHARASDEMWGQFDRNRLPALQEFTRTALQTAPQQGTVFYPFGGPDALTVTAFFPKQERYILIGLEPPGTLASARRVQPEHLAEHLKALRGTLDSLLKRSFFITRQMDQQLRGQVTDGVLADILVELARGGNDILGFREIMVNPAGDVVDRAEPDPGQPRNRGIALEFQDRGGQTHQLLYFTVNLGDQALRKNPQVFAFLAHGEPMVTFLKSTSYLPHQKGFAVVRQAILERSTAVLQDDSGVPYQYLASGGWKVHLFGEYEQPYGSFRYLIQKDLQQAYRSGGGVQELRFRIGYGYGRAPSNLLLAVREQQRASLR